MSRKHALLSASGASKWLNCTPSAKLESTQKESTSSYADEGTLAHDLAEIELKQYFDLITNDEYVLKFREIEQSEYYNDALEDYVSLYTDYCIERYNSYKSKPYMGIEDTVYLEPYIQGGFSHLDFTLIGDTTLEIIDLKFGKGVPVFAENNKQALIYALGAFLGYGFLYDVQTIKITIFQPRIDNISQWELSKDDLLHWANTELKQKASLAYEGKGELKAGEWCRFCKVKATCRAFSKLNLDLMQLDFEDLKGNENPMQSNELSDEEISNVIRRAEVFKNWLNSILEYALKQALEGKQWPGLKVVRGRSIRKYTDPEKIIEILTANGVWEENITYKKIIPITEMEKTLGKEKMLQLIGEYIVKPEGGPSLVTENDKRPAYDRSKEVTNDFSNL